MRLSLITFHSNVSKAKKMMAMLFCSMTKVEGQYKHIGLDHKFSQML